MCTWYDLSYTEFSIEILFLPAIKWYSCFSSILLELIKCSWKKKLEIALWIVDTLSSTVVHIYSTVPDKFGNLDQFDRPPTISVPPTIKAATQESGFWVTQEPVNTDALAIASLRWGCLLADKLYLEDKILSSWFSLLAYLLGMCLHRLDKFSSLYADSSMPTVN